MGTILIIEDNAMNMEMVCELLENANHTVIRAEKAYEGIKIAKIKRPDLILMDLNLEGMDGLTATKILKEDFLTKNIPVVALTAMVMQGDREKAFGAGCSGFISKPIDVSSFVDNIEHFLGKNCCCQKEEGECPDHSAKKTDAALEKPEKTGYFNSKNKWHKVLIIDDNTMNAEMLKEVFEQIGQSSVVAYSGKKALELVEKEKFDLILLDIMMPEMNGFDVIKNLKSKPSTKDIPVIFISALDQTDDIVKGFDLGSVGYITKPFKIEELKARILSILKIKDLQDELKAEKSVMELVFQFSADGIIVLNSAFEVISCNELFLKWLDLPAKDVINKCLCCIAGYESNFSHVIKGMNNGARYMDYSFDINTGEKKEKRFIEINCSEITSDLNEIEGYVLILRDITDNKEIEQQKETFVATLTHDLKTPVRAQIRALEMLLNEKFGQINKEQKEMIEETLNSNKYMFSMLENLLVTYKYENKSIHIIKHIFDVNNLIKDCCNEIKYLANDKNISICYNFQDEVLDLYADSLEIKRVIMNLISNAISYSYENGKIIVSTYREKEDEKIIISINDNGKGISKEELANLFSKYQSYAKKFRQVGTGLGLYLSKSIVEEHGGKILVESENGQGSTFIIKLPQTKEDLSRGLP